MLSRGSKYDEKTIVLTQGNLENRKKKKVNMAVTVRNTGH